MLSCGASGSSAWARAGPYVIHLPRGSLLRRVLWQAWCVQRGSAGADAWGQSCRRRWATSSMLNWSRLDRHLSSAFHLLALNWHSWSQGSRKSGITQCGETALDHCHVQCEDNVFVLCSVSVQYSPSFEKNCRLWEEGLFNSVMWGVHTAIIWGFSSQMYFVS